VKKENARFPIHMIMDRGRARAHITTNNNSAAFGAFVTFFCTAAFAILHIQDWPEGSKHSYF
jgi:hypothetical protein